MEKARKANPGGMRMVPVVDSAAARSGRARVILAGVTATLRHLKRVAQIFPLLVCELRGNNPGNIAHVNRR